MFKREVSFKGTEFEYSGSNTTEERINCTERIDEELIVQASVKKTPEHVFVKNQFKPYFLN